MAETQSIEKIGKEMLRRYLTAAGRKVEDSDVRTFDLIVDGNYAELKAKQNSWDKFDFISLTKNQKEALGTKLKTIFLVLNVSQPEQVEVVEINADDLLKCKCQEITHYEWNRGDVQHLRYRPWERR